MQYTVLQDTNRCLAALEVPVLPMLAAVDDGAGRWKEGFSYDAAHPNAAGHHRMFTGFDPSIAKIFAPEQIEAIRYVFALGRKRSSVPTVNRRSFTLGS